MDSIKLNSGMKRIAIEDENGDTSPDRVLVFNPKDVVFAEKFYRFYQEVKEKADLYKQKSEKVKKIQPTETGELPDNVQEYLDLLRDACEFIYQRIDGLFGDGSSKMLFQGVLDVDLAVEFMEKITPFIQRAREDKLAQYGSKPVKRRL